MIKTPLPLLVDGEVTLSSGGSGRTPWLDLTPWGGKRAGLLVCAPHRDSRTAPGVDGCTVGLIISHDD